jgi:hypothetical protein
LAVLSLKKEKLDSLSWSITFLIIGLIAGVLGLSGIAGAANPNCMDSVRCLSGSFCGQFHYGPPTARLRHEQNVGYLLVTTTPANAFSDLR